MRRRGPFTRRTGDRGDAAGACRRPHRCRVVPSATPGVGRRECVRRRLTRAGPGVARSLCRWRHGRRRHRASVGAAGARRHPPRRTERRARRRGPLSRGGSHRRRTHDRRTRGVARRMRTLGRCGGVRRTGRCARPSRTRSRGMVRPTNPIHASRGCSARSPRWSEVGGATRSSASARPPTRSTRTRLRGCRHVT